MKKQILLLGSILALCGCSKSIEHHYFSYGYFDTYVDIKIFEGEEQNLQELRAILRKYSKITDNYLATDLKNIYTINNTNQPSYSNRKDLLLILVFALGLCKALH